MRTIHFLLFAVPVVAYRNNRALRSVAEPDAANLSTGDVNSKHELFSNPEITEKWEAMDEFLRVMWGLACRWKYKKDIRGWAAEKVKEERLSEKDFYKLMEKKQTESVEDLNQVCGRVTAEGTEKCKNGCQKRWGTNMVSRNRCMGKCDANYKSFESRCKGKVNDLQGVFKVEVGHLQNQKKCFSDYCPAFPEVYALEEADQKTKLTERCDARCTAEGIKNICERKFVFQLDFFRSDIDIECQGKSGVTRCMTEKSEAASGDMDTCKTTGQGDCSSEFDTCKAAGNSAEAFCTDRQKMCNNQVQDGCVKTHREALETGRKKCQQDAGDAFKKCQKDTTESKKEEFMGTCETDTKPVCSTKCKDGCKLEQMNSCLADMQSTAGHSATQDFCDYMWDMITESSAIDPKTGDPLVK